MIPPRNPNRPANIAEEGWAAFKSGKGRRSCPYTNTAGRTAWLNGFDEAERWFENE